MSNEIIGAPAPIMKILQDAYCNGDLTIEPVNSYRGIMPKLGFTILRIQYYEGNRVIFNGAYEMKTIAMYKLRQTPGKLPAFICFLLAPKLSS